MTKTPKYVADELQSAYEFLKGYCRGNHYCYDCPFETEDTNCKALWNDCPPYTWGEQSQTQTKQKLL